MKTSLCYLKRSVWGVAMLGAITFTNAQQLSPTGGSQISKAQAKNSKTKKNQVVKNVQVFDSKDGSISTKLGIQVDNAVERANYEFNRLKTPNGDIPRDIRKQELKFSSKIATGDDSQKSLKSVSKSAKAGRFSFWKNRGPFNVGGRTRALAIDRRNENVILAGGVSGGLWRSENGGQTWRKVTRTFQNPSITAIVQDPRPGRSFTWYYASGERSGNSASGGGSFFQGNGVYKSQDGGRTWEQLRATANENVGTFESGFDLINSLAIDPTNGDLYVATFNGLFRSQDGGNSFAEVLESGFDNFVEISVSSTGTLYATIESDGAPNAGFLTSEDGETWVNITPPNFIPNFGRTKVGIDPSNENIVYFFTADRNPNNQAVLWRYDASATTAEETWVDLSANLPTFIPVNQGLGNLSIQGGYDMVMKVHPTQSNIVFIGGTNLYRSTTGFTTPAGAESWIGGNGAGDLDVLLNTIGTGASYPNHHADQHALVFYPSNPNRAISGHDGGVSITEDITVVSDEAEQVTWRSLSNGYITTQPYHVAVDPEAENEDLVIGLQDNGSWFTNSNDSKVAWQEQLGADGAYSAIADGGRTRYVSSQNGGVRRLNFDEEGNRVSFTRIAPGAASGFAFINPFILDPIDDNVMYMPVGTSIWRNNNLDEIPLFAGTNPTVNWVNLTTTAAPAGSTITAVDISKFPVANRLYYGTNRGTVFRMDNANIDGQEVVDLTTGKEGLPVGAFVNDVNIDPSDSDRVIITYSNYGVISLFLTEDAGETWTNISGNLEENADGSGNGPSVRSTAFLGGSRGFFGSRLQRVFAATSTGLYYANRLNGQNTVWRKENIAIGNAVTDEVVTRKDGFIAVASHGNGAFSARFPIISNPLPESTLSTAFTLDDFGVDENGDDTEIDITGLFVQSAGLPINIELINTNPELVTATLVGSILTLSYAPDSLGSASIGFVATSGEEQVSEGFTVTVSEPSIYEQTNAVVESTTSQNFLDFGALTQSADDFTIPAGNTWNINRVLAFGVGRGDAAVFNNVNIVIYEDNAGVPGEEVYNSGGIAPISDDDDANLNIVLPEVLTLESGNYWISIYVNLAFNPGANRWFWASQDNAVGEETQFRDLANIFGAGATDWTPFNVVFGGNPLDQTFRIFGDVVGSDGGTGEGEVNPLAVVDAVKSASVYPNPSNGQFIFNFGDKLSKSGEQATLSIFNATGNLVHVDKNVDMSKGFVWDAANLSSGFYYARITGKMSPMLFKLAKN
ncbi:T9SS C-terminal target domain-containing protein [Aquimarina sp. AD10]|uniref:T9SS type A sorting domain-containing protein n=1 Tax=Aquimarina sp. AD10 TaxID=1714849 RepID=UPI000E54F12B|nr:T9SS type A sorting domain-containing protein [Aquimarina sp. AD10]AXT61760.1 T9SS C-terminal target domain-containing protein [Aquimarina sp. AD10]RKN00889.1 T9SS C-terminal target domain-containing protein [Aquimarina sp. AD10]